MLQGRIQGMGGAQLKRARRRAARARGLEDAADRVVRGYSGGMKRRLDVALGLVHRPRVALPRRADDRSRPRGARGDVGRARAARRARGALTILLTTHYLEEADQLANRLAIVSRGQVVVEGTPNELKQSLAATPYRRARGRQRRPRRGAIVESLGVRRGAREGGSCAPRRERRARVPQILSALDRGGIGVEVGRPSPAVARRRLPPLHRAATSRAEDAAGTMTVAFATPGSWSCRQARNLMREPIWIALLSSSRWSGSRSTASCSRA